MAEDPDTFAELSIKEITASHLAKFLMSGSYLLAFVVVIYMPPGSLLFGLLLRSLLVGPMKGGGGVTRVICFFCWFFSHRTFSVASAGWTLYRPLLAN